MTKASRRPNCAHLTGSTTDEYHGLGIAALRRTGHEVYDQVLAHIRPIHHENVHLHGTHPVDFDGALTQLDADGYRPLRSAALPSLV